VRVRIQDITLSPGFIHSFITCKLQLPTLHFMDCEAKQLQSRNHRLPTPDTPDVQSCCLQESGRKEADGACLDVPCSRTIPFGASAQDHIPTCWGPEEGGRERGTASTPAMPGATMPQACH
jgi:hypothetical protein